MVGLFDPVGTVAGGGEWASESVVGEVAEASGESAGGLTPLLASVGPLEALKVPKLARIAAFHCSSVGPRREAAGIRQGRNEATTSVTSCRHFSGLAG